MIVIDVAQGGRPRGLGTLNPKWNNDWYLGTNINV